MFRPSDSARSALERAVREDPALADLAAMGTGVSTDGMRVVGVPVGVDAWVRRFVAKKARSVITDVAKLLVDVVSDEFLHNQVLHFCQNARMAFLGRNTPTPLLSEFMAQVDDTIVEAVCRHGTGGGYVDCDSWSLSHLGYLYPGTAPVMINLDHNRSCPWVYIAQVTKAPTTRVPWRDRERTDSERERSSE